METMTRTLAAGSTVTASRLNAPDLSLRVDAFTDTGFGTGEFVNVCAFLMGEANGSAYAPDEGHVKVRFRNDSQDEVGVWFPSKDDAIRALSQALAQLVG